MSNLLKFTIKSDKSWKAQHRPAPNIYTNMRKEKVNGVVGINTFAVVASYIRWTGHKNHYTGNTIHERMRNVTQYLRLRIYDNSSHISE